MTQKQSQILKDLKALKALQKARGFHIEETNKNKVLMTCYFRGEDLAHYSELFIISPRGKIQYFLNYIKF